MTCNKNIKSFVFYYGTNMLPVPITNVYPMSIDECGMTNAPSTNVYKGNYDKIQSVIGNTNTTLCVSNLIMGMKYYAVITSKNENGLESNPSYELEYTVPFHPSNSIPSKVKGIRIIEIK